MREKRVGERTGKEEERMREHAEEAEDSVGAAERSLCGTAAQPKTVYFWRSLFSAPFLRNFSDVVIFAPFLKGSSL